MATIKQIAEITNVSRGTIDRVLNNRGGVSPETEKKVRAAMEALNYLPIIMQMAALQDGCTNISVVSVLTKKEICFLHQCQTHVWDTQREKSQLIRALIK